MRNGEGAVKTGKSGMPSPFKTMAVALRMLFFSEKALYALFLNNSHTFNLVCFYVVTLFIPYKDMSGAISPDSVGNIVESFVMTGVFISILFLFLPKKLNIFMGFLRIMLAFEATSILMPITFLIKTDMLRYFIPLIIGWYLSLIIYGVSKIKGVNYWLASVIVISSFFMTIMVPAFFSH